MCVCVCVCIYISSNSAYIISSKIKNKDLFSCYISLENAVIKASRAVYSTTLLDLSQDSLMGHDQKEAFFFFFKELIDNVL